MADKRVAGPPDENGSPLRKGRGYPARYSMTATARPYSRPGHKGGRQASALGQKSRMVQFSNRMTGSGEKGGYALFPEQSVIALQQLAIRSQMPHRQQRDRRIVVDRYPIVITKPALQSLLEITD